MPAAIVYDVGAVSPSEILAGTDPGDLVVLVGPSDHARRTRPLFAERGCPVLDWSGDEGAVAERLRSLRVDAVVTFSERMLGAAARMTRRLGLPGHDPDVVTRLTDKAAQRRCLREAGVDPLPSVVVSSVSQTLRALDRLGLPAVAKPVTGEGSRNTMPLLDRSDAATLGPLLDQERHLLVEPMLLGAPVPTPFGDYVSVETVVVAGERHHLAVTGKFRLAPPFRESGQFWPARLDPAGSARVVRLVDDALQAIGVSTGLTHTEVKLTSEGPRVLEVNGRVGGHIAELSRRAGGPDLVRLAVSVARGQRPVVGPALPDRVYFQYLTPGPTQPGHLLAIVGAAEVRAMPDVTAYRPCLRPGDPVGGTATRNLDITCGDTTTHEDLAKVVDNLTRILAYTFDTGPRTVARPAWHLLTHA